MAVEISKKFRSSIAGADSSLQRLNDETADAEIRKGGWTCKQVIGHLIDSSLNNHQRFVRAAIEGRYEGPTYEQNAWIDLHGYAGMPWGVLLAHWRRQNELLCQVVERIPEYKLAAKCRVGANEPVTLEFLIEDYLTHLNHHITQIASVVEAHSNIAPVFISASVEVFEKMSSHINQCFAELTEEQVWHRTNDVCNSIGNLVLHLSGNVRQWIGHGVGGLSDIREREKEFSARGGRSKQEILALFETTVADAVNIIKAVPFERLTARIKPQNREVTVLEAILHVAGHLREHTGQIVFATKQFTGKDLQFFKP